MPSDHCDDIVLIGKIGYNAMNKAPFQKVKDNSWYCLYYDHRNKQSFLITPNMRATRCFGHYNDPVVAKWARNQLDAYLKKYTPEGYPVESISK